VQEFWAYWSSILQADVKIVPKFGDLFPLMSQVYAIWINKN
jgi:hypothetical protein